MTDALGPYALDEVHLADCRDALAKLPDACIDSVVTDPPYELAFMGQHWDSTGIAYDVDMWRLVLRALKPGAHLLAFGGTRTHHRMVCAIEDAGFVIRDELQWLYGSGFPKSLDISKAIDKEAGAEREIIGSWKPTGTARPNKEGSHSCAKTTANCGYDPDMERRLPITAPATPAAAQWQGWGTALLDEQSGEREGCKPHWVEGHREYEGWGSITKAGKIAGFEDFGGASRFFYIAKASPAERDNFVSADPKEAAGCLSGSHDGSLGGPIPRRKCLHPTVKPIELMRYLCRLVTPPGGIALDPFAGSGSTLIAAYLEGFHYLGFEREECWHALAQRRLAAAKSQQRLFK